MLPVHAQGRPGAEAFQVASYHVLNIGQALGAVSSRLEYEHRSPGGELALSVFDGDHGGTLGSPIRCGLGSGWGVWWRRYMTLACSDEVCARCDQCSNALVM